MKKSLLVFIIAILLAFMAGCGNKVESTDATPVQSDLPKQTESVEDEAREGDGRRGYYAKPKGGGEDAFTLMLYICGSDLESEVGAATLDIGEILSADIGDKLNIIIETGGASEWQNDIIPSGTNVRWLATTDALEPLEDAGLKDMTDPDTLTDFISYSAEQYPADRYGLILWDHGGGTMGGYAVDENFPDSEPMSVIEMDQALAGAGVKFDFIGFDACLMATAETAFMLDAHADYMVASQRTEPGTGWHYTDWISSLSADTSMDTLELGKRIADSFKESNLDGPYADELTLSVMDLTYVRGLFAAMDEFFTTTEEAMVEGGAFMEISKARYDSRDLTGDNEQVDLAYLVESMGEDIQGASAVMESLEDCIAYNVVSDSLQNHNGLCIYFPYTDLEKVKDAVDIYEAIGINQGYQDFIKSFSTLMIGGQAYKEGGAGNPGGGFDEEYWLSQDWVDSDLIGQYSDYYSEDPAIEELTIDEKGEDFVLSLSEEQWDLIITQELTVFMSIEGGTINLGSDNIYEFDEDGDLLIDFDYTWVALDGVIVPFYAEEDYNDGEEWYSFGYVSCLINGSPAEVEIVWDNNNPNGAVSGYRYVHDQVYQKGLIPFQYGDELEIVFDKYDENGDYVETGYFTDTITVQDELEVSYEYIGDADCEIYYTLYDIYQNTYWTESLYFTD